MSARNSAIARERIRPAALAVAALATLVLLVGCGADGTDVPPPPQCAASANLLENPSFGDGGEHAYLPWTSSQHAGEPSFKTTIDDGTVTVARIGTQPWYTLTQLVPVRELGGHELLFRADLRLDLTDEGWEGAMEPGGGLQVIVWGNSGRVMGGDRIVYRGSFEHEPKLGRTGWFKAATPIVLPERPTRVRVGFVHRANGSLSFRNPELLDCGPADAGPGADG